VAQLDLSVIASTSIATPGSGVESAFIDSTAKVLAVKDDIGFVKSLGRTNASVASQAPAAATRTYIAGSAIAVPAHKLQATTMFRWRLNLTKTAAGVAASTFDIAVGIAGTVSDTARVSFTKPAGTAAIDEAWIDIIASVRSIGVAGVMVGQFILAHNGNTVGHATIPLVVLNTVGAGFDMTVASLIVGLCVTTGAADAVTIQHVQAEALNL
jgi:hypothetical protein